MPEITDAIRELVVNAIEHSDHGSPTVRVGIEPSPEGDRGRVWVADNGPGIPEEERACLLLEQEIDQLRHNYGLGLVLIYWAVRLSGGDIEFEENEPRGSIVTLHLPRSSDDSAEIE